MHVRRGRLGVRARATRGGAARAPPEFTLRRLDLELGDALEAAPRVARGRGGGDELGPVREVVGRMRELRVAELRVRSNEDRRGAVLWKSLSVKTRSYQALRRERWTPRAVSARALGGGGSRGTCDARVSGRWTPRAG